MKEKLLNLEKYITNIPQLLKNNINNLIDNYNSTIAKIKDLSTTNYNLGIFHIDRCNMSDAKMRFFLVTKLNSKLALAHYHLARCHLFNLEFDKARYELELALSLDEKLEAAKYRLNLLNQTLEDSPIPIQVIEEDYDNLADQYENFIENQKKYEAPELLVRNITANLQDEDNLKFLDIGCGTGLVGFYLKQAVTIKSLTGIDISRRMLNLAEELEIDNEPVYDTVEKFDFNNVKQLKQKYDVITACMSLVYSNNLSMIFKDLEKIVSKNTIFGLVLLKSNNQSIVFDYNYGCFSFSSEYLKDVFKKYSWVVKHEEEINLFADGTKGLLVILSRMNN